MSRFYRTLLRLYPSSFRGEYADELAAAFAARTAGMRPLLAVCAALADVVPNAFGAHWDILRADLKHTARALRRAPGFAATAVLVVALGVGANAAAFSVADFVLVRALPFPHADRLVKLWQRSPGGGRNELSPGNYDDWKHQSRSFERMAAFTTGAANLTGLGEPRRVNTALVTSDLFDVLGIHALAGRTLAASDTVDGRSIVISYALWQTQFGGESSTIGRKLELSGKQYTIVGIMPRAFHFPTRDVEVWQTISFGADDFQDRSNDYLQGIGRLRSGATLAQARAELSIIASRLAEEYPKANTHVGAMVITLRDEISTRSRLLLWALCGASLCILILACANLGSLLVARAAAREHEMAVRAALGAGRERLTRQLFTESVVLAMLGIVAGAVLAVAGVPTITALVPTALPTSEPPGLDPRVLFFAAALVVVTALIFTAGPAIRAGGARALGLLREDSRSGGRQGVRSLLVMIEVAASVVLLISSTLLVRALWRLQSVDPGFRSAGLLTMRTSLPSPRYDSTQVREAFYRRVLTGVRALPGVSSAAYISFLPMTMRGGIWPVFLPGQENVPPDGSTNASLRFTTPQFFATLGIPLLQGRDVDETDTFDRPFVAVVSASFAKRFWPNEPALGKHFQIGLHDRVVVGVVGDIRVRGLEQSSEPQVYLPSQQVPPGWLIFYSPKDLVVRTSTSPLSIAKLIEGIVHEVDPLQPVSDVRTMDEIVASDTASRAVQLGIIGLLAVIALLLAGVGIHGLLSFAVSRRSREIGVRVALGARPAQISTMVLREGVWLAAGGIVPGIAIAYAAGRAMQALLDGVSPADPVAFTAARGLCAGATIIGALRPARRAATVDPMTALRSD